MVDKLINPDDPTDVADIFEEIIMIEPLGPCIKVHTQHHTLLTTEDAECEVKVIDDGTPGDL